MLFIKLVCLVLFLNSNLLSRYWGPDCIKADPATWLNREYTGEYKQREVLVLLLDISSICFAGYQFNLF